MKMTNAVVSGVYPIIETAMSKNTAKYKKNLQVFIERRSKDMYDIAPYTRIPFGQNDIDEFFTAIGVKEEQIKECLTKAYFWNMNFNPAAAKDPFTEAMMMVIRYFIIKNDSKNAEISAIYLAFSGKFYPSIHYSKFPTVQPI